MTESFLNFLLIRLDEAGFERLVPHEPGRMMAGYTFTGGGRCETRAVSFTGCRTCSTIPRGTEFASFNHIAVAEWPCVFARSLALPFADDRDYREEWKPEYAMFASGKRVHDTDDR